MSDGEIVARPALVLRYFHNYLSVSTTGNNEVFYARHTMVRPMTIFSCTIINNRIKAREIKDLHYVLLTSRLLYQPTRHSIFLRFIILQTSYTCVMV